MRKHQPGPCSQTAHFSDDLEFLTPPPGTLPASCPSFISSDVGVLVADGNGVEHINVNKAQDAWFAQTFTGSGSITLYPPSSVVLDPDGNVTAITGPHDPNVPVYSGKIIESVSGSFNNQSSVLTGTQTFLLSAPGGVTLSVHTLFHDVSTPGTDPNGPTASAEHRLAYPKRSIVADHHRPDTPVISVPMPSNRDSRAE